MEVDADAATPAEADELEIGLLPMLPPLLLPALVAFKVEGLVISFPCCCTGIGAELVGVVEVAAGEVEVELEDGARFEADEYACG